MFPWPFKQIFLEENPIIEMDGYGYVIYRYYPRWTVTRWLQCKNKSFMDWNNVFILYFIIVIYAFMISKEMESLANRMSTKNKWFVYGALVLYISTSISLVVLYIYIHIRYQEFSLTICPNMYLSFDFSISIFFFEFHAFSRLRYYFCLIFNSFENLHWVTNKTWCRLRSYQPWVRIYK